MNHRKPTERKTFEQKTPGQTISGQKPSVQKSSGQKPQKPAYQAGKTTERNHSTSAATGALTKQEKELLEDCLDELYEDYSTYRDSLKKDEEMNVTYKLFTSIVKKLGLRQPK